jgi:hypothetical protein
MSSETPDPPCPTCPIDPTTPTGQELAKSHPWVYSATITNGTIIFRVEVTDLRATKKAIEISGMATQENGAFAPIYRIIDMPKEPNGNPKEDDEKGRYFLNVVATPAVGTSFDPSLKVTIFVRVSKVWVTVLGPGSDDPPPVTSRDVPTKPIPTWGVHVADSHVSAPEDEPVGSVTLQTTPAAG